MEEFEKTNLSQCDLFQFNPLSIEKSLVQKNRKKHKFQMKEKENQKNRKGKEKPIEKQKLIQFKFK